MAVPASGPLTTPGQNAPRSGGSVGPVSPEDSLDSRKEHNASTLLCRLPAEILVQIIEIVQDRDIINEYPELRYMYSDPDWTTSAGWTTTSRAWMALSLVCSCLRDVIVHSPRLWAYMNLQWPKRWLDLCVERAGAQPLHFTSTLASDATDAAAELAALRRSEVAAICFPGWRSSRLPSLAPVQRTFLQTPVPSLRVLQLSFVEPIVVPRPFAACFPHLVHLDIHRVQIEEATVFPRGLRRLKLTKVGLSDDMAQLKHLFGSLPDLTELHMDECEDRATATGSPHPSDVPPPVVTHLHSLIVTQCSTKLLCAMIRSMEAPRHYLEISFLYAAFAREERNEDVPFHGIPAAIAMAAVLAYIAGFWARATGATQLPPVTLKDRQEWESGPAQLELSAGTQGSTHPALYVTVPYSRAHVVGNPFLPLVTGAVWLRRPARSIFDTQRCPLMAHVPALRTLEIRDSQRAWEAVAAAQAWADAYARLPVDVEFVTPRESEEARVLWNTHSGPLEAVDWSVYQVAEASARPPR